MNKGRTFRTYEYLRGINSIGEAIVTIFGRLGLCEVPHLEMLNEMFVLRKLVFLSADLKSTQNSTLFSCVPHQNPTSGSRVTQIVSLTNYAN